MNSMKKFIVTAAMLALSTPVHAQSIVMISLDRWNEIKARAETVCRRAMLPQNSATKVINDSGIARNVDERLFILSLCALYAQGQIDLLEDQGA